VIETCRLEAREPGANRTLHVSAPIYDYPRKTAQRLQIQVDGLSPLVRLFRNRLGDIDPLQSAKLPLENVREIRCSMMRPNAYLLGSYRVATARSRTPAGDLWPVLEQLVSRFISARHQK
jgi:hypothetical protein